MFSSFWLKIKTFFKDSETIAWARFQALLGTIAGILTYVDPFYLQPLMTPEFFAVFLIVNALATEYLRRRRDNL